MKIVFYTIPNTQILCLALVFSGSLAGACAHQTRHEPRSVRVAERETPPKVSETAVEEPEDIPAPTPVVHTTPSPQSVVESENGDLPTQGPADIPRVRDFEEVIRLYRRLHAELETEKRSELITELLSDPRMPILELGFELAHRNLSARTVLSARVGETTSSLLQNEQANIRGMAAGLLTRLVTPDAMLLLTDALNEETDPIAAEPMLLGVARWPNADATDAVVRWSTREDARMDAAITAAWAFEIAGLITDPADKQRLLDSLRDREGAELSLAGMRLMSRYGEASDLSGLAMLLVTEDEALRERVADALVETSRATELLALAAENDPRIYGSASESLIRHRATPAGLARLAELRAGSEGERQDAIDRMGNALSVETLAEGVSLANLDDASSVRLLERLLTLEGPRPTRVLRGIVLLAEIELRLDHASQALDIADSLIEVPMDPMDRTKLDTIHRSSAILSGNFDHQILAQTQPALWFRALDRASDPENTRLIAAQIRARYEDALSEEQRARLDGIGPAELDSEE